MNEYQNQLLLHKCEVAKLGSKAGNFVSGKRGGWRKIQRERDIDRDRERESKT